MSQRQLFLELTAKKAVTACSTFLLPQLGQVIFPSSYSRNVRILENAFWQEWQKYSYCGMAHLVLGDAANFSPWPLLVQCCVGFCEICRLVLCLNGMRSMKNLIVSAVLLVGALAAAIYILSRPTQPHAMKHALTGYVLEVNPELNRITVRNGDIPGVMASMVMDYRVKDSHALAGIKPGDTIRATMVMDGVYSLEDIKITGKRP